MKEGTKKNINNSIQEASEIIESSKVFDAIKEIKSSQDIIASIFKSINDREAVIHDENQEKMAKSLSEAKKSVATNDRKFDRTNQPNNSRTSNKATKTFRNDNKPSQNSGYSPRPYNKTNNMDGSNTYNVRKDRFPKKPDTEDGAKIDAREEKYISKAKTKFSSHNKKSKTNYNDKKKTYNKKQLVRRGLVEEKQIEGIRRQRKTKPKNQKNNTVTQKAVEHAIITKNDITVKYLAEKIGKPVSQIVKKLFLLGIMATINSSIDFETAELVSNDLGITLDKKIEKTGEQKIESIIAENLNSEEDKDAVKRSPIVTVMGHVDHGKTSLLDCIRKTNISDDEAGGITQNIGAYTVDTKKGKITFIDTPGHAAFTEMRSRGAKVTDIAILVVAADDAVMPQTIEAINHIKDAEVPLIVAINKIDKQAANIEKVKQQLADQNILCEEWGGETVIVPVSAHTKEGIDELLDMIILLADVQDIKANPDKSAVGVIIESNLDRGKGPVATIIIKSGTLKIGDIIVSGTSFGKVRALINDNNHNINEAGPSTPAEVLGFNTIPESGSTAVVMEEKQARKLVNERMSKLQAGKIKSSTAVNLDELFSKFQDGSLKSLNVIIKAGVMGHVEVLKKNITKIENEEFKVKVVHCGVGAINENDILLAEASKSIIIGFNVKPEAKARSLADSKGVDIRPHDIIYNVIEELEYAIKGMLAPKFEDVTIGTGNVIATFKSSKLGTIAGVLVKDGSIQRQCKVNVLRNNEVIKETEIETLRVEKDDVKEVKKSFECGIKLKGFNDIKEGDILSCYITKQIKP